VHCFDPVLPPDCSLFTGENVESKSIDNLRTSGIAKSKDQSFEDLYKEREKLYEKHGEIVIGCKDKKHEHIVAEIIRNMYA